jgi:hypothetical protein
MSSDPITRAISRISEAALAPERWVAALQSITEAVGALGVGYLLLNKQTGGVEWVSLAGLSVDVNDYINYYAARDPYRPALDPRPLEYPGDLHVAAGGGVTSSSPLRAKVRAIASMSCTAERLAEGRRPISSFSRANWTTPSMASSAFSFEITPSSTRICKMLSHNIRLSWPSGSGTDIVASSVLLSALQNHNPGCAAQAPKPSGRAPEYPSNEGSDVAMSSVNFERAKIVG